MNKLKVSKVVSAVLLSGSMSLASAAPLPNGAMLGFDAGVVGAACDAGTCFAMEVSPGFFLWTPVEAGTDGGIVIGKDQASGGQELGASASNSTVGEMTAAWFFFGNFGTFDTTPGGSTNVFDDTSGGPSAIDSLFVAWNGNHIPMGGGSVNSYNVSLDGLGGGSYDLNYSVTIAADCACGFEGVNFVLSAAGSISGAGGPVNSAPTAGNVSVSGNSGAAIDWTPAVADADAGDTLTCSIASNATNGNADVAADCSAGTYTSGAGFVGMDSFDYSVTDGTASASAVVSVMVNGVTPPTDPCADIPVSSVATIGGGQSTSVNSQVQATFTGQITTTAGLTSGGKNAVKICSGTVDYVVTGASSCQVNSAAANSTGTLAIGDKLICTSKPNGSDTDRFSVKSGL